jgi:hypothetical protein
MSKPKKKLNMLEMVQKMRWNQMKEDKSRPDHNQVSFGKMLYSKVMHVMNTLC